MTLSHRAVCATIVVCCSGWARADAPPNRFTLGKYIPSDVWLYIHEVGNPERDFICGHWDGVWRAAAQSGIDTEIKRLIGSKMPEAERAGFEAKWEATREALAAVPWSRLGKVEFAMGQRIAFPMPSYIFLFRNEPADTESLAGSLSGVLRTVASLSGSCAVRPCERQGAKVWSLCVGDVGPMFEVFVRGDVIGATLGKGVTDDVLGLMAGDPKRGAIVDDATFRKALKLSERPEDGLYYFRWARFLSQIRDTFHRALDTAKHDEDIRMVKAVLFKALAHLDFCDYTLWVRQTDGVREVHTGVTKFLPDTERMPVVRALTERKRFERFDRFVPKDATGFWMSSTLDIGLLYHTVIDFIKKEIPNDGPKIIARWDDVQAQLGFDLSRDLFGWLSGEIVSVSLPGPPGSEGDFVLMVRTKNPELAWKTVSRGLDYLGAYFEPVMVNPAVGVEAKGFRSVFHPMMMMMQVQPVIGMYEDWLVIGSRSKVVNRCLATARGSAPSIRDNARFQREGIPVDGEISGASFTDLRRQGEQMGMAFGMMGIAGGSIPDVPKMQPIKAVFNTLSRLAPVVSQIDFHSSSATVSRFTGDGWVDRSVLTYKDIPEEVATNGDR